MQQNDCWEVGMGAGEAANNCYLFQHHVHAIRQKQGTNDMEIVHGNNKL